MMRRDIEWINYKRFNRSKATEHFVVVGASGSGKTTILNNLMASVLPIGANTKALVYDPKLELIPLVYELHGIKGEPSAQTTVKILNPFDSRCFAWDMASDIDSVIAARQLATILTPESGATTSSETFFSNAVRDVLTAVIVSFIETTPNAATWTFRDVLLACLYGPYLRFILGRAHLARSEKPLLLLARVLETYFGKSADKDTTGNVHSSLSARLSIYEPIAAAWSVAAPWDEKDPLGVRRKLFSLRRWALTKGEEVLVLGNDETARAALDAVNQAIFKRATELVLSRPEKGEEQGNRGEEQTWFFLDEVREAGKLEGFSSLLTKGRSKGCCVALGFQDIDGLRDVYGAEVANELTAQCNNIAVLRINSPSTAEWASSLFGKRLSQTKNSGFSVQGGGDAGPTTSRGTSEHERPFLHTDSFLYLKTAVEAKGVEGFSKGPEFDLTGMTNEQAQAKLRFRVDKQTEIPKTVQMWQSQLVPRQPQDYLLQPWTEKDWIRLGFEEPIPDWDPSGESGESGAHDRAQIKQMMEILDEWSGDGHSPDL